MCRNGLILELLFARWKMLNLNLASCKIHATKYSYKVCQVYVHMSTSTQTSSTSTSTSTQASSTSTKYTSLVYNLGMGSSLPRNNFQDQNWQGSGLGEHPKNLGPLFISATVEASNFKFGIQVGLGSSLPRNNFQDKNWRGSALVSTEKVQDPYLLQYLKLATSKLVHNFGLGSTLQ